jgi:DNA polymerase-1
MQSLYLIDSSIYVFNAWFGLPDSLTNEAGEPNNALLGFTDFVYRFLHAERPGRAVFAFDESLTHSARNEIYADYKANRSPAPQELKRQFHWCREFVQALGFSQVASDRHEADDLIGSLATLHRDEAQRIVILSGDKDLAQLIREHDEWWSFAVGHRLGYRALHKKFGVRPEQIADQLALAGDKVDNIPGIPGIGMTIAGRLLVKFGDLPNLRANIEKVGDMKFRGARRVMDLLKEHGEVLDVSSRLTPIDCAVDVMRNVDITRQAIDQHALDRIMSEHRFGESRQARWASLLESLA